MTFTDILRKPAVLALKLADFLDFGKLAVASDADLADAGAYQVSGSSRGAGAIWPFMRPLRSPSPSSPKLPSEIADVC